ncbi:MAG: PKD domain-containing protein [Chitinophagaceae bacterium]|nr:PKD domain-containing protein [Chitinophagaceae bacterium]MBL0057388.1 PKD domain-containing protein [Chitinophagaceae bacterium]
MQFIENKGQWDDRVEYRGDFSSGSFFLQNQGFTVVVHNTNDLMALSEKLHGHGKAPASNLPVTLRSHSYTVDFLGSSQNLVRDVPDKMIPTYNNYFVGKDASKWASDCRIYQAVTYQNVYPNIDVRYYSDEGKLKYDIIVRPGGNPNAIAMRYEGVDALSVKNRELVIGTTVGDIRELYPYSYQASTGKREEVECKYVVRDNVVRFKVKDYSPDATLVIDPTLIFSTFTGSTQDNWGYTATPGPDGSLFAGGIAIGGGFPISPGAYQTVFGGGNNGDFPGAFDIAIIKFTPNTGNRVYATYLGGNGNEQPHSMICDAQGNLVIAGRSTSDNYPLKPALNKVGLGGAFDIVVTKLNAAGNAILGSIKIGGSGNDGVNIRSKYTPPDGDDATRRNYGDDARSEVILDANNNVYLASCTQSSGLESTGGFPIRNSAIQTVFGGARQDGVIIKFTPDLNAVLFSTYFGGNGEDACFVLSLNPMTSDLYVAGGTSSNNLLGIKPGVISGTYGGGETDGFITEIANDGSAIISTSYLGTGGNDLVYGVQFDKLGFPYVMGTTTGSWPVVNANYSNPGSKQFISKLKPDLTGYVYSTVFGTAVAVPNLSPTAFLVDRCENVYVSGWGGGINRNKLYSTAGTLNMPEVNPLTGIPAADGDDFYFFVLEKNAQSQFFGSHFGHNGGQVGDHVDGGTSRFDANGVIYQAVCSCIDGGGPFPTTPGVWSSVNRSLSCNEAALKIEMNFAGVGASIKATINGLVDTIGCVPLTIKFTDTLAKGKMYVWVYNDPFNPVRDTTFAPNNTASHTFTQVGTYRVMLIAVDSNTCNITDTAYVMVKVGDNLVDANFNFIKLDTCNSLRYQFNNLTTAVLPTYTNQTFLWDFGDGSPKVRANINSVIHTFPSTGTYKIRLIVDDTVFCNVPDTAEKLLRISPNVKALFTTPAIGCVPYPAEFKNTSIGGIDFYWEFGDGTPLVIDNNPTVTHTYANIGTYKVRLIAIDTSTCNKVDTSAYFTITVFAIPSAGFTWAPNPPIANTITRFTNLSAGAIRYQWDFGDGESSTEVNPSHLYNATGSYRVVLYAFNAANCVDSFIASVPIVIFPVLDVPNAFTPGRYGTNGIVKVTGFGIGRMNWRIYNRWGQVVFETTDRKQGWDGTFKGAVQAMDVYTYTLDVEFTDGVKLRKTGDISLLR